MKLNLSHNTVIRETLTDGFLRYFQESLVPQLVEKYGEELLVVEMYENHLEKPLAFGGEWYYPLSLTLGAGVITQWVAWEFPKNGAFYEMNPYAYASTSPLAFRLVDEVPEQCLVAVGADTLTAPSDALPISVGVATGDVRMLVGKYSQSFVDALAASVTREIERAHQVRGLSESGIRLEMLFAPNTYMEHTCEGVTYRRLAIKEDGARVSKDFWVRWQRAEGNEPATVSDAVREGEVVFSIGEDVPQKVREKEYRYLLRHNAEKYRSAMGRKTVTEWRELLKKAIKRGTLLRADAPSEESVLQEPSVADITQASTLSRLAEEEPKTLTAELEAYSPTREPVLEQAPSQDERVPEAAVASVSVGEDAPEMIEDDPWLARLKEYAGEESAPEEQAPAPDENTDEFRDAMMRMRSILGLADEPVESQELTAEQESDPWPTAELEDDMPPFDIDEQPVLDLTESEDVPSPEEAPLEDVIFVENETQTHKTEPVDEAPEVSKPLFAKPVQASFFEAAAGEPEQTAAAAASRTAPVKEDGEDELRRQIRDGVLREIEARERERLAEEARRAVMEKEEREAQMARVAKERMEAEASRRELEQLREQTRALSEELRAYTQMCMDVMSASAGSEAANADPISEKPQASIPSESESAPAQQEIQFTLTKADPSNTPDMGDSLEEAKTDGTTEPHSAMDASAEAATASVEPVEQKPERPYQFTEEELSSLLREHAEKLRMDLLEEARRIAREELEAERAAYKAELASTASAATEEGAYQVESVSESLGSSGQESELPAQEMTLASVTDEADAQEALGECTEQDDEPSGAVYDSESEIAELLLRSNRESAEEERRLQLEALIREQEEKLLIMRREEEERRARAEQLIAEQARLEELARIERERAEEENRRLEEERRRAEEIALQSYEKHLIEAKRLEEELEAARRRREEEDLRIAEAERRIAEQNRLAEQAREEQRMKNEEARRLTEEAQRRVSELDAAREESRELAERTEEESRLMQQTLQQQEQRLRAEALRREEEERQRIAAEQLAESRREATGTQINLTPTTDYNYVSRVVHLFFGRAIDPNVIGQIHRLMSDTIAYFNKSHVSISVRAEIVGPMQLDLNFVRIPKEEEPLLINIVKVLGRSNIGIRRASIDD